MQQTPTQCVKQAEAWIESNRETYDLMVAWAARDARANPGRDLRIAAYCEKARARGVSIRNATRAYIARKIEKDLLAEGVKVRFTKSKSKIDPLMEEDQ